MIIDILKHALELAREGVEIHNENSPEYKVCAALIATLEAKDEPVGSFMTRLQAIDFLLKMRPQTEPTEKQIIATIDAYSALFGDMIESPAPPQRKPLTNEEICDAVRESDIDWHQGWTLDDDEPNRFMSLARAIEAAHGIKGEA